jgi:hypothetical protein
MLFLKGKKKKKRKEKKEKLLPLFYSSFLRRWLAEAGVSYHISHTNTGITVLPRKDSKVADRSANLLLWKPGPTT